MITLASLFNLAGPDLIIIFFVILLLFGAKKLPELAKGLGQAVKEFGRAKDDFERELSAPPAQPPPQEPAKIEEPKVAAKVEETPAHDSHEEQQVPTTKVV